MTDPRDLAGDESAGLSQAAGTLIAGKARATVRSLLLSQEHRYEKTLERASEWRQASILPARHMPRCLPLVTWVVFSVIQGLPESSAMAVTEIERGGVINHPVFFLS